MQVTGARLTRVRVAQGKESGQEAQTIIPIPTPWTLPQQAGAPPATRAPAMHHACVPSEDEPRLASPCRARMSKPREQEWAASKLPPATPLLPVRRAWCSLARRLEWLPCPRAVICTRVSQKGRLTRDKSQKQLVIRPLRQDGGRCTHVACTP